MPAPVALFVYSRFEHTKKTVESLLNNVYASSTDLIVFSDAARSYEYHNPVNLVRHYVSQITGFKSLTVHHRPFNYGLSRSITSGVAHVLEHYGRVIVLEDDMVTSRYFLMYMNAALVKFAEDDRVISIHGYVYPVKEPLPEVFFLRGADCWGWATWSRGWSLFNPDGQKLFNEIRSNKLTRSFDFNGSFQYMRMLQDQIKGKNNSWAILWYASAFLAGKLTLYPGRSLVQNIGNDGSGIHCDSNTLMDVELSNTPVDLNNVFVKESIFANRIFEAYFKSIKRGSFLYRVSNRILRKLKLLRFFL